jgi:poly(A) polymerase
MKINFPYTKELKKIADILLDKGDEIKLVGGCIRNFLMKKPITDFDLACKYRPEKTMEILGKAGIKVVPTGIAHGTVTAIINNIAFEITTLRKDIEPDGRHSKITFTDDYLEDAKRRDFTINAIYLDFKGNLYDYFNGIEDIGREIIKYIGNPEERIQEDYLRILRFFRFYAHYGFSLDKNGLIACIKYKANLLKLSGERIKTEMFKILNSTYPANALKIMQDNGILQKITNDKEFDFHKLTLSCLIRKKLGLKKDAIFNLALLIKGQTNFKKILEYFKNNWKLSNKEYKYLLFLLSNKLEKYNKKEIKKVLFELKNKDNVINLMLLDCLLHKDIKKRSIPYLKKTIIFIKNYKIPTLPITGADLKKIGLKEGKEMGEALNKAQKIFIESNYQFNKKKLILMLNEVI